jgi:hypothetical protein
MSVNLNNGQSSSVRISNFTINQVVKSEAADQDSPDRLVIFSNCSIEGTDQSVGAMTAIHLQDESTIYAPPSAIRTSAGISSDERNSIELAVSEGVVDFLNELKANSQFDPKKIDAVNHFDFVDMLSECC